VAANDLDGDGLPDAWEHKFGRWKFTNGVQMRVADADADLDNDDLTSAWEYALGISPVAGDSNGDGTEDGDEDSDGDGLSNAEELILGTSPLNANTDGDGISDSQEIAHETDALDAQSNVDALLGLQISSDIE